MTQNSFPSADLDRLASALRQQDARFQAIIAALEFAGFADSGTRAALLAIERNLRQLPYAA